jgi:hypothetical protein
MFDLIPGIYFVFSLLNLYDTKVSVSAFVIFDVIFDVVVVFCFSLYVLDFHVHTN